MAPPAPHDNVTILNVAMKDLDDADRTIIEKAAKEFKEKCRLSFSKTQDKVIQKTSLLRILLLGESDIGDEQDLNRIEDSIILIINQAMRNHNRVFLTTFGNIMKETFAGFPVDQLGPCYFNIPNTEMDQPLPARSETANKGKVCW
jgi:hypothetical protein